MNGEITRIVSNYSRADLRGRVDPENWPRFEAEAVEHVFVKHGETMADYPTWWLKMPALLMSRNRGSNEWIPLHGTPSQTEAVIGEEGQGNNIHSARLVMLLDPTTKPHESVIPFEVVARIGSTELHFNLTGLSADDSRMVVELALLRLMVEGARVLHEIQKGAGA